MTLIEYTVDFFFFLSTFKYDSHKYKKIIKLK